MKRCTKKPVSAWVPSPLAEMYRLVSLSIIRSVDFEQ
jgi:hypothetical protein